MPADDLEPQSGRKIEGDYSTTFAEEHYHFLLEKSQRK